jgi:hypothetical protein
MPGCNILFLDLENGAFHHNLVKEANHLGLQGKGFIVGIDLSQPWEEVGNSSPSRGTRG